MAILQRTRNTKPRHVAASNIRNRAVQHIPYNVRLQNYEREKEALFYRMGELTLEQLHDERMALTRKWQV